MDAGLMQVIWGNQDEVLTALRGATAACIGFARLRDAALQAQARATGPEADAAALALTRISDKMTLATALIPDEVWAFAVTRENGLVGIRKAVGA